MLELSPDFYRTRIEDQLRVVEQELREIDRRHDALRSRLTELDILNA